ncbi:putative fbd-associated F-box protein at1g61330 [Phtheirospermum japonicum]|uniref:Putative fbd-associated F-box protein at1g61330 n=1 Tax=Phtheirospermum japonicum TaxID=374723 RepID=A0A830D5Z2_9LAMI|nr:putative fbd-associated F-box protein at1g61330 [Phtheirospermum japonicum]
MADDVVETIFSYLPIKKLFALAVLSRRYRFSWRCCRNLSFDKNFAKNLSRDEFKIIVDNFFRHRLNSSADRFCLYFDVTDETNIVVNWIQQAICLGIKELELDFTLSKTKFMLSYNLINVASIEIMKLVNCEIDDLPLDPNGLCNLRVLTFENVRANPMVIQAILINCLALKTLQFIRCGSNRDLNICAQNLKRFETLVVKDCHGVESITIDAPTLSSFHYHGKICQFNFQSDLSLLNDVILDIAHPRGFQRIPRIKDVAISLAFVKTLTISSIFLELVVTAESYLNPSDVAIFLKKCPYVERVFIDLAPNAFGHSLYWEFQGRNYLSECITIFPFLSSVKLKGFTMKELPMMMGKFFLRNAIHLQHLVLVKAKNFNSSDIFTPDCLRWGISSSANIEIYDYRRDTSIITPEHLKDVY